MRRKIDTKKTQLRSRSGFTLIEIIVAVAIFSVVMLVAVGALLSLLAAHQRAQTFEAIMNNLNIAMENMIKDVRVGTHYHCGTGSIETPQNCTGSNNSDFAFEPSDGDTASVGDQVVIRLSNGQVERSDDGGSNFRSITSPEVEIQNLSFRVHGSSAGDGEQPRVLVVMSGTAGADEDTKTDFNIQAQVTQRLLDS